MSTGTGQLSESWQFEYREKLNEHFAATFSYINEGHLPQNHRDGDAVQLWVGTSLLDRRLDLSAGVGPYLFFNSVQQSPGSDAYRNDHGVGAIFGLAATWHTGSNWLIQMRSTWITTENSFDSLTAVAGIGYQFASSPPRGTTENSSLLSTMPSRNEITLFAGQTIVNSFSSQSSVAAAVEYRRALLPYLDWTLGWLYEGSNPLLQRNGPTTQLWAVREFLHELLSLGVGGGAYFAIDHNPGNEAGSGQSTPLSGILTFTARYCLKPPWYLRASWNRVITSYDRDTDVILGGIGYRF